MKIQPKIQSPAKSPLFKLTTSGNFKSIGVLNKSSDSIRSNITIMITFAIKFVEDLNAHPVLTRDTKVNVRTDSKLIAIISKHGIEWQPKTEKIQKEYKANAEIKVQINESLQPIEIDLNALNEELGRFF